MDKKENTQKNIFAEQEENIQNFWEKNNIFKKSIAQGKKGDYVFYDGPPFATGTPHYGHIVFAVWPGSSRTVDRAFLRLFHHWLPDLRLHPLFHPSLSHAQPYGKIYQALPSQTPLFW